MSLAKLTLCIFVTLGASTALDADGTCANGGSCTKEDNTQTSQLSAEGLVVDTFGLIQSTHILGKKMSGNLNITPTALPKEDTAQNTGQLTAQKERALDGIKKAATQFSMEKMMQFNTSIREMRQMLGTDWTPENEGVIQEVVDTLANHIEDNIKRDQQSAKSEVVTRIADLTEKTNSLVAQKTVSDVADTTHSTCVTEEVGLLTAHKTCTDEETQLTIDKPTNEFCGNSILEPVVYQNSAELIAYLSNDITIDYSKDIADIIDDLAAHAAEVNKLMTTWVDAQKLIAETEKDNWETYNQKCIDITKQLEDKTAECGEKLAAWQLQHEKCLHEKSVQKLSVCGFGLKYQSKCESKINYETTRGGIKGTGTVLSEPDREQEFTHFNRIICVLDTFKTAIEFDSDAVDACTVEEVPAADKFAAEVGRIDLQEDEYEALTSEANFNCNEAEIPFGDGDLWTVPENTDGVLGWLPTADDYSKATGYAYAISSDQSNAPFEFCATHHPTPPTCGLDFDSAICTAGSGTTKPATTPCHLDGGCTSADCCEGMFPEAQPLLPNLVIKLQKSTGQVVEFSGSSGRMQDPTSYDNQKWYLRKCSGTDASSCLGDGSKWATPTTQLRSGDVVAWVPVSSSNQALDCSSSACTIQPYPPPHGHWGTPYRIMKLDAADGNEIFINDSVYFYGMQLSEWKTNHIINCDSATCSGSTSHTVASSTFKIQADTNALLQRKSSVVTALDVPPTNVLLKVAGKTMACVHVNVNAVAPHAGTFSPARTNEPRLVAKGEVAEEPGTWCPEA